jgi:ABC-type sugar transport system substrate-binding protein
MIGVEAGRWIRDELGGEAEVAILENSAIISIVERSDGIISGIHEYAPNAQIVAREDALTPEQGMTAAETILLANPNLQVIVGFNDSTALGAYEAVHGAGRASDTFFIGGVDAVPDAIEKVKEGGIFRATVDIDPFGTGGVFLDTAIAIINAGGPIPFNEDPMPEDDWVVIPMRGVNTENVFDIFP